MDEWYRNWLAGHNNDSDIADREKYLSYLNEQYNKLPTQTKRITELKILAERSGYVTHLNEYANEIQEVLNRIEEI